ncbi:hypothetical protein KC332_g249 [Hortaea werneckii]|nr:hypothetical protein KC350_g461 [Hortaea werneckii]KAI6997795.1 hypothetical protein KC329_g1428 [Hortaea werneckii]KAI7052059.1 hypothetical protein KC366_g403 [Hortaea werneckii]KAI7080001.1 hypothetical protein KC327_g663 [Hortaea werneckii]KAI7134751.1 hypothetical protein KC337_g3562 [Hortaea werneckii]
MSSPQGWIGDESTEYLFNATRVEDTRRGRQTIVVKDHEGGDVSLTWFIIGKKTRSRCGSIPTLPYQVYITNAALEGSDVPALDQFCAAMYDLHHGGLASRPHRRFDIYQTPQENSLACVEHQRKEVQWRNRNGIWPPLVSNWSTSDRGGDRGFILVIDSADIVKHGISLVCFDPDEYHDPMKRRRVWHLPGDAGDLDVVRGIKIRNKLSLIDWLRHIERNPWSGRSSSRVQPPAVGAAPYDDAEDGENEDDELLNLEQQVGGAVNEIADDSSEDEAPQPNGKPRIIDRFRLNELWTLSGLGMKQYGIETYEDSQSQFTVSVWDRTLSATRPHFSVTLYCGSAATFSAESLFRCLNKGLVRKQPWTLDVKRGFDSLPQAHLHHGREASRRASSQFSHRSSCIRMLVRSIVAGMLPVELCNTIEEMLCLPTIPDYACSRIRPFHDLMLFFAPKPSVRSLSQGPVLVFSNPSRLLSANGVEGSTYNANYRHGVQAPDTEELRVRDLRFWHRTADEIHTLASLCTSEDNVSPQLEYTPSATISIDSPLWRGTGRHFDGFTLVTLRVKSPRTLTLHTHGLFSHDLFFEALQLVDLTTNRVLPQHPYEASDRQILSHDDSWSTSASLGFSNHADVHSRLRRLEVLEPEQNVQWRWNGSTYWELRKGRGELIDGHQYALRANPDVFLKAVRWTYGKPGALEEICGRPPMPVSLESEVRFTVHKVRAPGSFEEWFYSIP